VHAGIVAEISNRNTAVIDDLMNIDDLAYIVTGL
jgi:hypothetical protein